jgi:hypothetical protein
MEEIILEEEKKKLDFDFTVLEDFCKVRNFGAAPKNNVNPTPRVLFLLDLCRKYGLEPILDIWPAQPRFTNETKLEDVLGFNLEEVDQFVDDTDMSTFEKEEEKRVLKIAFAKFDLPLPQIISELSILERQRNSSKNEKRIYNMMIKIKKEANVDVSSSNFFNIYIKGTSNCAIMAHHDIVNPGSDNCNDNSASCINVIAAKLLNPSVHVIINDAEEIGGLGANRSAEKINEGYFGQIDFVLNLELTAVGGKNFFIEAHTDSKLFNRVATLFPNVDTYRTPFHDGIILRRRGIDSLVINPLPRNPITNELEYSLLHLCHSNDDRISLANYDDMYDFVTEVVTPIIDGREAILDDSKFNAPLNEAICKFSSIKENGVAYGILSIVQTETGKFFELKYMSEFKKEEEIKLIPLCSTKEAYKAWKYEMYGPTKIDFDNFKNYQYF